MSCKKAIGVANSMKEKYGEKIEVKINTLDSEEAQKYAFQFRGATNVLLDRKCVPLDTAIDKDKMKDFISQHL